MSDAQRVSAHCGIQATNLTLGGLTRQRERIRMQYELESFHMKLKRNELESRQMSRTVLLGTAVGVSHSECWGLFEILLERRKRVLDKISDAEIRAAVPAYWLLTHEGDVMAWEQFERAFAPEARQS
jgi:hypothetical protein